MNPCCCLTLRTWSLVIGILELIGNAIRLIGSGVVIAGLVFVKHDEPARNKWLSEDHKIEDLDEAIVVLSLQLVLITAQLIVSIFLVVGVKKSSQALIKVWLVITTVNVCLSVIFLFFAIFKSDVGGNTIFVSLFSNLLNLYFLWVVFAFFSELKKGGTGRLTDA